MSNLTFLDKENFVGFPKGSRYQNEYGLGEGL